MSAFKTRLTSPRFQLTSPAVSVSSRVGPGFASRPDRLCPSPKWSGVACATSSKDTSSPVRCEKSGAALFERSAPLPGIPSTPRSEGTLRELRAAQKRDKGSPCLIIAGEGGNFFCARRFKAYSSADDEKQLHRRLVAYQIVLERLSRRVRCPSRTLDGYRSAGN